MKKHTFFYRAAFLLFATLPLASCGGEPASDNLQPEATPGDYVGDADLDTTTTMSTDTTLLDTTQLEE